MTDNPNVAHIDVGYVADLARIALTPAERQQFGRELDDVLSYVAQLGELDVDGIEPTAHAAPQINVMRDDEPGPTMARADMIANAPAVVDGSAVRVPPVIEEDY